MIWMQCLFALVNNLIIFLRDKIILNDNRDGLKYPIVVVSTAREEATMDHFVYIEVHGMADQLV